MRFRALSFGTALTVALLILSVGVAAYVYHARTPDLALQATFLDRKFAPSTSGKGERGRISYFVRYDEPHATVELVGRNKVLIRTIGNDVALRNGESMLYKWNGLDNEGELVEPGRYRLRVILPSVDREMVFPRRITIEPQPFSPTTRAGKEAANDEGNGAEGTN